MLSEVLNILNLWLIILTIPVYIFILVVIIRYKNDFKSSFFIFFFSTGVADLWFLIHKTTFHHIPALVAPTWAMKQEWMATVNRMGMWSIYMAEVHGVLLMTINRFTALVKPMQHKKIWTRKKVKLALILQWLLALPWSIPMIFKPYQSSFKDETLDDMKMNDKEAIGIWYKMAGILEPFIFCPSLIVMYVAMFYYAYQHGKQVASYSTNDNTNKAKQSKISTKMEFRLAILGLVISAIYALLCVTYVADAVDFRSKYLNMAYNYLTTLFIVINPYLLLIFSSILRQKTKQMLKCG